MDEKPPVEEEKVDAVATLLFLAFILIVGYILQSYYTGIYPFTANSVGRVSLASPIVLIILTSLALTSLIGGMIRIRYPKESIILVAIVGLTIIIILGYLILSKPINPFQIYL
ncbi:MAG: hypothetical protein QW279_08810 [Candidatus Jordarchaeaceae archaeon]